MRESDFCYWHDPARAEELADARRLGGIRRKRERSVATAFDFTGLSSIEAIRRLFPDVVAAWDEQMQSMKESAAMAIALAEIDDVELPEREADRLAERVEVLLADLVDWSKATALEKLGEGERGLTVVRAWLRSKLDAVVTR